MSAERGSGRGAPGARGIRAKMTKLRESMATIEPGSPIASVKAVDDARVRVSVETVGETGRPRRQSFVIGIEAAHRLGLMPGGAWSDATTEGVIESVARDEAMRAAMTTASRSATSKRKLIDKLCQKGHDRTLASAAAVRMAELGLINDAAVADAAARTIARRTPSGRAMIESKLRAAGFDAEVARSAAIEAASTRDARGDALALAQKKVRVLPRGLDAMARRRRVESALARRGFDPAVCRWAAAEALGAASAGD